MKEPQLVRGMGLLSATSANMLEMIGIGPFITIPLIISAMGGPQAMIGWLLGAIIAICDGLVWAELGAAMPGSGGSYHYLQQAYGPARLGRLMSFLFIWQTVCTTPFVIASGAVGFANYTKYLWPAMTDSEGKILAASLCLVVTALLYRNIQSVGRLSIAMWVVVLMTVGWIITAGIANFRLDRVLDFPPNAFHLSRAFFIGLGAATLNAVYDYGGYNNVCYFGGEVKDPGRVIPRAVLLSILAVAAMYLTMTITIMGVVPWREAVDPNALASKAIVAAFIQTLYGSRAAAVMTVLILWTAFASIFALMLGCSRIPYAAAVDGRFFKPFARVHENEHFPTFSLMATGVCCAAACWLDLTTLISASVIIQIIARDMGQIAAVTMIRRYRTDIERPFKMWLYPLPSVIALLGWTYILATNGLRFIAIGFGLLIFGIAAYLWQARRKSEWPFENTILKKEASALP